MNASTSTLLRNTFLSQSGIHAREWISPAVATFLAKQLSKSGNTFLKEASFIIVPLLNPDGYEYTHTHDRLWRKNRRKIDISDCLGVDLNRNWGVSWGQTGSSSNPCSLNYHGTSSFSEPETVAMRDLIELFQKKIIVYTSLHSYGQLLLNPWSHTEEIPPRNGFLKTMAKKFLKSLNQNKHYVFKVSDNQ